MFDALVNLDVALIKWVNIGWSNPILDSIFAFLSGNVLFVPALILLFLGLWIKGGAKGRVFVILLAIGFVLSENGIVAFLKDSVARERPFWAIPDVIARVGKTNSYSMPSAHAASMFLVATVASLFYSKWKIPAFILAFLVGLSRIYNGAHYPSDVFVGACVGMFCGVVAVYGCDCLWRTLVVRYLPMFTGNLKSLRFKEKTVFGSTNATVPMNTLVPTIEEQYKLLGYLLIFVVLIVRWCYLWAGKIELSEDEAYQWCWSKYIALSYFSKPPLIAYTQWLGTHLWGDVMFGVRFFSPLLSAITSLLLFRFLSKEVNVRTGFYVVLAGMLAPLLAVGSILMTVDPLAVMFWTATIICCWYAMKENRFSYWMWMGVWSGMGFLSKYSTPLLIFSLLCYFVMWKPARVHLKKPGIYTALLISLLFSLPVLLWNYQNDWISYKHVVGHAEADSKWHPTLRFFGDFWGAELGLLNPVFFVMLAWAAIGFWKLKKNALTVYLFSMGGPMFIVYGLYTFHSRVQPNWIAPAVIGLFLLGGIYWNELAKTRAKLVKRMYLAGVIIGLPAIVFLHDSNMIKNVSPLLPAKLDPLRRVRAWSTMAELVDSKRQALEKESGKPCFVIGDHYGFTGQLSFEIPASRVSLNPPTCPLCFYMHSTYPENQFYFWPSYREIRVGQNAIFVEQVEKDSPVPPERIVCDFQKVENMGYYEIEYRGRIFRRVQLFACYDCQPLKNPQKEKTTE